MANSILDRPKGDACYLDNRIINYHRPEARAIDDLSFFRPYYESIRVREGVLVFFEDHMQRLIASIGDRDDVIVDKTVIFDRSMHLIQSMKPPVSQGSLRVVLTADHLLIYLSDMDAPADEVYKKGIVTNCLMWERDQPHVKVLIDAYRKAVADKMNETTPYGRPYEVLLVNQNGQITEGSRSNFFVMVDDTVYSPPEALILIGITRKYVMKAISQAGLNLSTRLFDLDELQRLKIKGQSLALFITSSPFDILPIAAVENICFDSAAHPALCAIAKEYDTIVHQYIVSHR